MYVWTNTYHRLIPSLPYASYCIQTMKVLSESQKFEGEQNYMCTSIHMYTHMYQTREVN